MKKIYVLVAIATALSLASCGGSTSANTAEEDSLKITEVATLDEEANGAPDLVGSIVEKMKGGDAVAVTEAIEKAQTKLQELIETGDAEAVKSYAGQLRALVDENAAELRNMNVNTAALTQILATVESAPASVESVVNTAGETVISNAHTTKAAVEQTVRDAADKAVEDAKTKADEAASKVVNEAADKLKAALEN